MKVHELPNARHLTPQKLSGRRTPHVTIETNTTCNIRCTFCYAIEHPMNRAIKQLYRLTSPHEFFADTLDPDRMGLSFAAAGLADVAMHPSRMGDFAHMVRALKGTDDLRFHYIVIQQAPRLDPVSGKVQFCWQCPDATIRNGRLVPVCMAGRLDPLGDRDPTAPDEVVAEVRRHLDAG